MSTSEEKFASLKSGANTLRAKRDKQESREETDIEKISLPVRVEIQEETVDFTVVRGRVKESVDVKAMPAKDSLVLTRKHKMSDFESAIRAPRQSVYKSIGASKRSVDERRMLAAKYKRNRKEEPKT